MVGGGCWLWLVMVRGNDGGGGVSGGGGGGRGGALFYILCDIFSSHQGWRRPVRTRSEVSGGGEGKGRDGRG